MLHLRRCILARLLSSPTTSISPLHRLLSFSPRRPGFAAEEYLVEKCGLSRAQALRAAARLSHVRSPTNPNAVLAFLADLGLSGTDAAALVGKDPLFLCAGVERTLGPVVAGLTGLGMSRPEVARLVSLAPIKFRSRSIVSKLRYFLPLFGPEMLLRIIRVGLNLLSSHLERVVKPNVAFLRECGLGDRDVAKLCLPVPWLLSTSPERVQAMAARAEGLGVPRGSMMFRHALHAVAFLRKEKVAVKAEYLKSAFRWSDAEGGIALCKAPRLLTISKEVLQRKSKFLISEVRLEPGYIAHRPAMLSYSLEGRLRPRYYVLKFLKENGLLDHDRDYYYMVSVKEEVFIKKYISPHNEAAPHLAEDYAAARRGEVPTSFRFALTKDRL